MRRFVDVGDVVADLGCYTGYYTLALAQCVAPTGKVYAVDIDDAAVAKLERRARRAGLDNIEAHPTTAAALPFIADASVDFVLASGLLCSMADRRDDAVAEIARILKPGGRALLSLGSIRPFGLVNRREWRHILSHFDVREQGGIVLKWALVASTRRTPSDAGPTGGGAQLGAGPRAKTRRGLRSRIEDQGVEPSGDVVGPGVAWAMGVIFRPLYRKIARHLMLRPDDVLLDVACGSGAFLDLHASRVRRVAGLDHSEVSIAMARRRLRDRIAAGTAELVVGDAEALPWPDSRFSAVTCNCLGCFAHPEQALREMYRVLGPGGRAVLSFDAPREGKRPPRTDTRFPVWDESEIRTMIEAAGLSVAAIEREGSSLIASTGK